jgi:hypothetical protein
MIRASAFWQRLVLLALQTVGFFAMLWLASSSVLAVQIYLTVMVAIFAAAFVMHMALSVATRSWMPGVYTSIFPGLPTAAFLLWWLWHGS